MADAKAPRLRRTRDAGLLEALRDRAAAQHHEHAEDPGQDAEVAAELLAVAQPAHQVGGEPGESQRQAPVAGEACATGGHDAGAGEQVAVGHALAAARPGADRRVDQRALAAEDQPQHRPHQADDAQRAERPVPGIIDDDPVERRHGDDDAERRALGDDGGRQAAQRIGEPFVDGVGGDRRGRAFAGAQDDAAGDQHFQADRAQHRELHQRPHDGHHQERVARRHVVGDEAHDHRGQGEQEEERRADQPELLRRQMELGHDRLGGQPDHDLVGEVDQHEEKDQRGHAPRTLERAIRCCH